MNKQDREIDRVLEEGSNLNPMHPGAVAMHSVNCRNLLILRKQARRKPKAPRKILPFKMTKQIRAERRQLHRLKTADLRREAMARAGGYCEWCGGEATEYDPLIMHHTLQGVGRRRQKQSLENVVMIHVTCHDAHHRGARK